MTECSLNRSRNELLKRARREIAAALLNVTLDQELGRETSPAVKNLAAKKLPPIDKPNRALKETDQSTTGLTRKQQLFRTLRREIFAAEMKVVLDQRLGRETSPTVKQLAGIKLPPI